MERVQCACEPCEACNLRSPGCNIVGNGSKVFMTFVIDAVDPSLTLLGYVTAKSMSLRWMNYSSGNMMRLRRVIIDSPMWSMMSQCWWNEIEIVAISVNWHPLSERECKKSCNIIQKRVNKRRVSNFIINFLLSSLVFFLPSLKIFFSVSKVHSTIITAIIFFFVSHTDPPADREKITDYPPPRKVWAAVSFSLCSGR